MRSLLGLLLVCYVLFAFLGKCRLVARYVDDFVATMPNDAAVSRNFGITAVCLTRHHLTSRRLTFGKSSFFQVRLSYYPNCVCCYQLSNLCLNGNVELNPGPVHISTRKSQLSCLSLNARSTVFKKFELQAHLA